MGKIYMSDLNIYLVDKAGLDKHTAQQFLESLIETIQEGVNEDRLVKIKGLGTFKVIDVDARESVNVNTGERVTISGHQKLTFTPDNAMKELVNKPFSQFETVVLNEGVEFNDEIPEPMEDDTLEPDSEPVMEVVEVMDTPEVVETPKIMEESETPEVPESPNSPEASLASEAPDSLEASEAPLASEASLASEAPDSLEAPLAPSAPSAPENAEAPSHSYWWLWLMIAVAACVISFAGGYLYGRHLDKVDEETEQLIAEVDSLLETPVAAVPEVPGDSLATDTTQTTSLDTVAMAEPEPAPVVEQPVAEKPAAEPDWKKYEAMDVRVRTGAYGIVGTDHVIKVKSGDTMKRIAKRTLGDDMECYIEVYNNISSNQPLTEGQEIKIPKLETKKRLNKKNN